MSSKAKTGDAARQPDGAGEASAAAGTRLIVVLGDQLTPSLASLLAGDPARDVVVMAEVDDEATYVRHHKKKLVLVFSAMRHFAEQLRREGWQVDYTRLDDAAPVVSITDAVERARTRHAPSAVLITEPGEWRVRNYIETWAERFAVPVDVLTDTRFVCTIDTFKRWAQGRKQLRMEHFYREMRRETGLLMDGAEPVGGKWNFDHDNRKPAKSDLFMPEPKRVEPDAITREVIAMVAQRFDNHFGALDHFWFAVTREDALDALDHFIAEALASFGDYQDAMLKGEAFLYHSLLSMYLNLGLLTPLEMCERAEAAHARGEAPLNAVEGYIRQIIGWREYVRGIYWREMPGYVELNFFEHDRGLPAFYWTGKTRMLCLQEAIGQTEREAYAHHIQRLMVTGTFALLAGIHPRAVHAWYLMVYADAYEWVELPNTLGMSQFGDGGLLASKPYAASGAYINRMSDYCKSCPYDVKARTGENACPFNYLYWDFLNRHRGKLKTNARMRQMYATYDRFEPAEKARITKSANAFLDELVCDEVSADGMPL